MADFGFQGGGNGLKAFAGIYVADGVTAQSIPSGATYTKLTGLVTNGQSLNCTSDAPTNHKITITKPGKYQLAWTLSMFSGTSDVTWRATIFAAGTEQPQCHGAVRTINSGDILPCSGVGFVNVATAPLDIDLRIRQSTAGSVNLTPVYSNINVNFVGN
jgi:hypothetical protein